MFSQHTEKTNEVSTGSVTQHTKKSNKPTISRNKQFWSNMLTKLQQLGKALMFPIAVLPFAALLNRFGSLAMELNPIAADGAKNAGYWIGFIIQKPGVTIFDNLALVFALGTAFGLAKDNRGEAALSGAALYLILMAFLTEGGIPELFYKNVLTFQAHTAVYTGDVNAPVFDHWKDAASYSSLFYVKGYTVDPTNNNLVVTGATYILDIGVLGGIVAGCMIAYLYNKFKSIKLPQALSFFGGRRFVPMMTMLVSLPLAFLFAIIWPWFQYVLVQFGELVSSGDAWAVPGAFLYGLINRFVQPFGLHHIINTFLWFQLPIDGNLVDVSGHIVITPEMTQYVDAKTGNINGMNGFIGYLNSIVTAGNFKNMPQITADNWGTYFSVNANKIATSNNTIISYDPSVASAIVFGDINAFQKGLISGNFQTGYFPMYWGGLTAACGAMILAAPKDRRKKVAAFLGGVAAVAALTGIDEPVVFSFIFVGPILWVYNAVFTAIWCAIGVAMHMHIGFGFSGGFIDYIISFAQSWGMSKYEGFVNGSVYGVLSNPLWMLLLAATIAPVYFFSFYFTIKKMDIKTPGREDDGGANLVPPTTKEKGGKKTDKYAAMAAGILDLVGEDNIVKIENCATRLRLIVKDNTVGQDADYKNLGAFGVKRLGHEGLQIIIGTDVEFVADAMKELAGNK